MIATPPAYHCTRCAAPRTHHGRGLCRDCFEDQRPYRLPQPIVCQNCEVEAPNRGRGLCPRCYQFLWRTGTLPPPNRTTPEEVLGE